MKNIIVILVLLLGAAGIARWCGADASLAGRIGLATVFAFTALGHFVKRDEMAAMLPATLPSKSDIVIVSVFFEAALATLVLPSAFSKAAGIAICVFLILVTPVNIHAAVKRVDFGSHAVGPRYLILRLPLQFALLFWTYWFAIRGE
jgi:uncharacterized membrane protein